MFEAYSNAETIIDVNTDQVFIVTLSVLCELSEAAMKQWTFESRGRTRLSTGFAIHFGILSAELLNMKQGARIRSTQKGAGFHANERDGRKSCVCVCVCVV
jgi:hypothetical protein